MNAFVEQLNSAGGRFFEFAGPMFMQASLLILIVYGFDRLLRNRVQAVFRYWLWMLVLVKLVLPTSLATPVSLGNWLAAETPAPTQASMESPAAFDWSAASVQTPAPHSPPAVAPAPASVRPIKVETVAVEQAPASPVAAATTPVTTKGFLFLGWTIVAVGMGLLLLRRTLFAHRVVTQGREAEGWMDDCLESCRRLAGVRRNVRLRISANATSPAVCGLLRPTILIPEHLVAGLKGGRLRAILLHELAHIRRGDLWVNLAQSFLQTLYFYNPFVWLANGMINRVREQAVDETVLATLGARARDEYLDTLVSVARRAFRQPAPSLRLLGVVESKNTLKERVNTMLNRPVPTTARLGFLGAIAVALMGTFLIPMSRAARESERGESAELTRDTGMREMRALQDQMRQLQQQMEQINRQMMRLRDENERLRGRSDKRPPSADWTRDPAQPPRQTKTAEDREKTRDLKPTRVDEAGRIVKREQMQRMKSLDQEQYERQREAAVRQKEALQRTLRNVQAMPPIQAMPDMPPMPVLPTMPELPPIGDFMAEMTPRITRGMQELAALQQQRAEAEEEVKRARAELQELREQDKPTDEIARAEKRLQALQEECDAMAVRAERQANEFSRGMEEWGEQFGKRMERWGEEFGRNYGQQMEQYGKQMERWGEQFGRQMDSRARKFSGVMQHAQPEAAVMSHSEDAVHSEHGAIESEQGHDEGHSEERGLHQAAPEAGGTIQHSESRSR